MYPTTIGFDTKLQLVRPIVQLGTLGHTRDTDVITYCPHRWRPQQSSAYRPHGCGRKSVRDLPNFSLLFEVTVPSARCCRLQLLRLPDSLRGLVVRQPRNLLPPAAQTPSSQGGSRVVGAGGAPAAARALIVKRSSGG
jgi:hypothetical protein